MEKIAVSISIAIVLGVTVMLIPVITFPQFFLARTVSQEFRTQSENNFTTTPTQTPLETAQTYGKMDVGPEPFPMSLLHVMLIVATSFVVALGTLFFLKKKEKESKFFVRVKRETT